MADGGSRSLLWARSIRDSGLPTAERAVAWALATYMDDNGVCRPKQETLAEATGLHLKTLRVKVAGLRKSGWVRVELVRRGEGRGCQTTYVAMFPKTSGAPTGTTNNGSGPGRHSADEAATTTADDGRDQAPGIVDEPVTTTAATGTSPDGTTETGTSPGDDHYRKSFPTTTADRGSQELPRTPKNSKNTPRGEEASSTGSRPPAAAGARNRPPGESIGEHPGDGDGWPRYGFEAFWDAYPADKRVLKAKTRKAWMSALNEGALDVEILKALEAWKSQWVTYEDRRFIPETPSWFEKRRWASPPAPPTSPGRRPSLAERNDAGADEFVARLVAVGQVDPGGNTTKPIDVNLASTRAVAAGGNP